MVLGKVSAMAVTAGAFTPSSFLFPIREINLEGEDGSSTTIYSCSGTQEECMVDLADEEAMRQIFGDCELGAEPPIGRLYGIPTLMDESLFADDRVTFQAGTHCDAITMSLADYRRVAQPEVAYFGRHV